MNAPDPVPLSFGLVFFGTLALAAWSDWRAAPCRPGFLLFLALAGVEGVLAWLAWMIWR